MLFIFLDAYRNSKPLLLPVSDIDIWNLFLIDKGGKKEQLSCPMIGGVVSKGHDMTKLIQKAIPTHDLRAFCKMLQFVEKVTEVHRK